MAEVIKTVKSSGGNYTSISAWVTGEQRALGVDEIAVAEVYNDFPSGRLEDLIDIVGFTGMTATAYPHVRAPAGAETTGHTGTSCQIVNAAGNNNFILKLNVSYCRVRGLEWVQEHATNVRCVVMENADTNQFFVRNLVRATQAGFCVAVLGNSATVVGNVLVEVQDTAKALHITNATTTEAFIYQNTLYGKVTSTSATGIILKNNVVITDNGTPYPSDARLNVAQCTNNASKNGATDTLPGSNNVTQNLVNGVDFTDWNTYDFTIPSGSKLVGVGANLSSVITKDIAGVNFTVPYPIGAYMPIVGGTVDLPFGTANTLGFAPDIVLPPQIYTIKSANGNYNSVSAFIAAQQGALSSNEVIIGEVYNDYPGNELVDTINFSGFTGANDSSYVVIRAAAGNGTNGQAGTGVRIVNSSGNTDSILSLSNSYGVVEGLEFRHKHASGARCINVTTGVTKAKINRCLVKVTNASSSCIELNGNDNQVSSCVILQGINSTTGAIHIQNSPTVNNILQNSILGRITQPNGTGTVYKNNVAITDMAPYATIGVSSSSSNNASKNGASDTLPGSNNVLQNLVNGTDITDWTTQNLSIPGQSILALNGANLSSTVPLAITGDAFAVPYPIGAFKPGAFTASQIVNLPFLNWVTLGYAPDINTASKVINLPNAAISVLGFAPEITILSKVVELSTALSAIVGYAPSVDTSSYTCLVPLGNIETIGLVPTVAAQVQNPVINLATAILVCEGLVPEITITTTDVTVNLSTALADIYGYEITVEKTIGTNVILPLGLSVITGYPPSLALENVTVPLGQVTTTGFAPQIDLSVDAITDLPAGTISSEAQSLTVDTTNTFGIFIPLGQWTTIGYGPDILATVTGGITLPLGFLALTGFAPSINSDKATNLTEGYLVTTGFVPTIDLTSVEVIDLPQGIIGTLAFTPYIVTTPILEPPPGLCIDIGSELTVSNRIIRNVFGNGYIQSTSYGLSTDIRTWSISLKPLDGSDLALLEQFFTNVGAHRWFYWTLPGDSQQRKWRIVDGSIRPRYLNFGRVQYSFTIEEMFGIFQ